MKGNKASVNVSKKEAQHDVTFAEGGSDHMFGKMQAEPQKAAQTSQEDQAGPGGKFAKGGSTKMFGFHGSVPATAGQTGAR